MFKKNPGSIPFLATQSLFNPGIPRPQIRFSLVIPTYNEARNIEYLLRVVGKVLDAVLPGSCELVVVDDDSPDQTWRVAAALMQEMPYLRVIRRRGDRGLSTAVVCGWQAARGEVLGVMDGDLQHPPEVVVELLEAIEDGADLAVASRHVEGGGVSQWSIQRRIVSRGAQMVGLLLLPGVVGRVADPLSGFFVVRRNAIAGLALNPMGYKILLEVLARGSIARVAEVGYVFQERQQGQSKISLKIYWDYLRHLLRLRLSLWPTGRFLRFVTVGASGIILDSGLLYLLHDSMTLGIPLSASKLVAAEVAIFNNFVWNDAWTFSDISRRQPGAQRWLKRLIKFNAICLMGILFNSLLLIGMTEGLHFHYLVANLIAIALVVLWNFYMNLKLTWQVR